MLSNFQLNTESNPELNWFCFTSLCDWSRNIRYPLLLPTGDQSEVKLKPITTWLRGFS